VCQGIYEVWQKPYRFCSTPPDPTHSNYILSSPKLKWQHRHTQPYSTLFYSTLPYSTLRYSTLHPFILQLYHSIHSSFHLPQQRRKFCSSVQSEVRTTRMCTAGTVQYSTVQYHIRVEKPQSSLGTNDMPCFL
jgi:hypothetical protein